MIHLEGFFSLKEGSLSTCTGTNLSQNIDPSFFQEHQPFRYLSSSQFLCQTLTDAGTEDSRLLAQCLRLAWDQVNIYIYTVIIDPVRLLSRESAVKFGCLT